MKNSTINAIILVIGIFSLSNSVFAQNLSFFIGPMATGHLSTFEATGGFANYQQSFSFTNGDYIVTPSQDMNIKQLLGMSGGVKFGFQLGKFSIVSGARYVQKGAKYESRLFEYYDVLVDPETNELFIAQTDIGTFKGEERQNFIQIPLLARYQFMGDDFGITLSMGPAFNIGVGEASFSWDFKGVNGVNATPPKDTYTYGKDLEDLYKPVQTSFIISPGIVLPVNDKGKLSVNIMWEVDLSSSINETVSGFISGDQKNKSFGIGVSYEHHLDFDFRLGTKH